MTAPADLPDDLHRAVNSEFAGEPLRWAGQPSSRMAFWRSAGIWLFAVPWTLFALFWETLSLGGFLGFGGPTGQEWSWFGAFFVLFGLPFAAIGLGMMAAPFWLSRRAARSVWVITARRIALITLGRSRVTVRSILPQAVFAIERTEKADGSGSLKLIFGEGRDSDGDKVERSETLQGIPDVRRVEDIIRRMMEEQTVPAR
jgi:hypothetical protein